MINGGAGWCSAGVSGFLSAVFSVVPVFAASSFAAFDLQRETGLRASALVVCGTGELSFGSTLMSFSRFLSL